MIYTRPDYYDKFQCIADKCEDTCCAGWQIVIDEESLEKYRKLKGDYIWKVMSCVDWESGTFRQDNKKRCAFLNPDNLCDLYKNAGECSLCKTCREYPRHTEEFEDVREVSLSISCPEVARILMEKMEPVEYISYEVPEEEETEDYSDFDPFLFSILEDSRKEMLAILQDRKLPLKNRAMLVLGMAHDMQGRVNRQDMFDCFSVIEKYTTENARRYIEKYLAKKDEVSNAKMMRELFDLLYELELLRDDWNGVLDKTKDTLFCSGAEFFAKMKEEFAAWKEQNPEIDIQLEQIMVYFLFTYYPGAVYDGAIFAKAQMAVFCTWMVELLWMAHWLNHGKQLSFGERIKLLYRFSREVEHSDENLTKIDKIMGKKLIIK